MFSVCSDFVKLILVEMGLFVLLNLCFSKFSEMCVTKCNLFDLERWSGSSLTGGSRFEFSNEMWWC